MRLGIRFNYRFNAFYDDPPPSGSASRRWKKRQLAAEIRRTAWVEIEGQLLEEYPHRHRRRRDRRSEETANEAWWRRNAGRWNRYQYRAPFPDGHMGGELLRLWSARA